MSLSSEFRTLLAEFETLTKQLDETTDIQTRIVVLKEILPVLEKINETLKRQKAGQP